jgi:hypothetical protein
MPVLSCRKAHQSLRNFAERSPIKTPQLKKRGRRCLSEAASFKTIRYFADAAGSNHVLDIAESIIQSVYLYDEEVARFRDHIPVRPKKTPVVKRYT